MPPLSQAKRSPSPAGRLKEVFTKKSTASSKGSASNASSSPERKSRSADLDRAPDSSKSVANLAKPQVEAGDTPKQGPDAPKITSSERIRRLSRGQKIDTTRPPQTPPDEKATPVIVNTPPTPTDPNYPTFKSTTSAREALPSSPSPSDASPSRNMIQQRRGRASSTGLGPSKLSNITPAPLTPTPESGLPSPGNPASGFFSSMISAVQNTAHTLSNTISTTNLGQGGSSSKLPIRQEQGEVEEDNVEVEPATVATPGQSTEAKELAVRTLGMGDLSLSQLGIMEPNSAAATPMSAKFPDMVDSRARSDSAPVDSSQVSIEPPAYEPNRPHSLYEHTPLGDRTPPQGSVYEGKSGIQRSGSIRSVTGRRRKRGSSAATGGTTGTGMTIGAAIAAANASVVYPHGAPKLTGFAVASKKRNRDFHSQFKSVPDDDYLIEDYSCALQREILAHGRLYVSEGHLCFSSNIFGWVTTLVMSFDEIVSVEKRSTALVFKNGLEISTLHAKHVFASFTSRDSTYDLIVKIWKLGHPSLKSSLNGVRLQETGGDRTEKVDAESVGGSQTASGSEDESDEGDDIYDEDEENDDVLELSQALDAPSASEMPAEKAVTRKPSGAVTTNGVLEKSDESGGSGAAMDFPGPVTHPPTDCGDTPTHYDKVIGDDVIPAPLGKVYNLLFGPPSAVWMGRFLTVDQKCTDLQIEDKRGLGDEVKSRSYSYIKPLNASIGPRQTKCMVTEQLEHMSLDKSVNVLVTTQNPDVPSGNLFAVKTKYCLSWAENNATRVQVNCTIEWTSKSWLKGMDDDMIRRYPCNPLPLTIVATGPIEKGANDGQTQFCKDLFAGLKSEVVSRPKLGLTKLRKRGRKGKSALTSSPASDGEGGISKAAVQQDWGLLEPARPFLSPFVDAIKPILTGNVVYGLLVGLLVAAWFGFGSNAKAPRHYGHDLGYVGYADRVAAYEEIWRREEGELWEWMEERVGLNQLGGGGVGGGGNTQTGKRTADPRAVEQRVREERMSEREIREAIRVTEEKLRVLESIVDKDTKAPQE